MQPRLYNLDLRQEELARRKIKQKIKGKGERNEILL